MNRKSQSIISRTLLVFIILLMSAVSSAMAEREIKGFKEEDSYGFGFADPFGNDTISWGLYFEFNSDGNILLNFIAPQGLVPERLNNDSKISGVDIVFKEFDNFAIMTLFGKCYNSSVKTNLFECSLKGGFLKSLGHGKSESEVSTENILFYLNLFDIELIRINGVSLPKPYPSAKELRKLFDTGIGHFGTNASYDKYCNILEEVRKELKEIGESDAKSTDQSSVVKSAPSNPAVGNDAIPQAPQKTLRPADIPEEIDIVSGRELVSMPYYRNYNCTFFKKTVPESRVADLGEVSIPELFANPLGLKELSWAVDEATIFKEAGKTGCQIQGYYHNRDKYNDLWSGIEFLGCKMWLPGSFIHNSTEIKFVEHNPMMTIYNGEHMSTSIEYKVYYETKPGSYSFPYPKNEIKKFNKGLLDFYDNLIFDLQKQGYNFKKDKPIDCDRSYSLKTHDGKSCSIKLRTHPSWSAGNNYPGEIWISIGCRKTEDVSR